MFEGYAPNPFTSRLPLLNQEENDELGLMYYKGTFDPVTISEMSKKLWSAFSHSPMVRHKIFSIFIELSQNVSFYSSERPFGTHLDNVMSGIGSFYISKSATCAKIYFSNIVNRSNFEIIFERSKNISTMSVEQLRILRKDIRENTLSEDSLGANFGLVQVAVLCRNNIEFKLEEVNEHYFNFSIKSTVLF